MTNSRTPTRRSWDSMIARCYNPGNDNYARYGGRGIKVCDRWRHSFESFLADMGEKPIGKTLDRIENDGDYTPSNCRWATPFEQGQNKRNNRRCEWQGLSLTLSQWSERTGIPAEVLRQRIRRDGWPVGEALTTPLMRCFSRRKNQTV